MLDVHRTAATRSTVVWATVIPLFDSLQCLASLLLMKVLYITLIALFVSILAVLLYRWQRGARSCFCRHVCVIMSSSVFLGRQFWSLSATVRTCISMYVRVRRRQGQTNSQNVLLVQRTKRTRISTCSFWLAICRRPRRSNRKNNMEILNPEPSKASHHFY